MVVIVPPLRKTEGSRLKFLRKRHEGRRGSFKEALDSVYRCTLGINSSMCFVKSLDHLDVSVSQLQDSFHKLSYDFLFHILQLQLTRVLGAQRLTSVSIIIGSSTSQDPRNSLSQGFIPGNHTIPCLEASKRAKISAHHRTSQTLRVFSKTSNGISRRFTPQGVKVSSYPPSSKLSDSP